MAINLSDNLQVNFPKHIDARLYDNQTPYSSSAQVTGSIISPYRYKGLTVFVSSSAETAEYWFRDGIADSDLILKTATAGTFLTTASNENNGNVLTISKSDGTGYQITIDTGSAFTSYNFSELFVDQSTWTVNHNLGFKHVILQVFDTNDNQIIPSEIHLVDNNQAVITFPSNTTGTVVATLGGATFSNAQLPASPGYSVQYNDGGGSWGGSSKFTFDGEIVTIYNPSETRVAFTTNASLYNTSNITQRTVLDSTYLDELNSTAIYTGTILDGVGKTTTKPNDWDLIFLSGSDNEWYPVPGNDSSLDSRLLGIFTTDGTILTEGYITVGLTGSVDPKDMPFISGSLEPGAPVYLSNASTTGAFLTTVRPSTSGDTVRIVGHLIQEFSEGGNIWSMYFRPDHTWVEIL